MKLKFNTLISSVLIAISFNSIAQTGTPTQIKYGSFVSVSPSGTTYQRDLATDAIGNMYGVGYVKSLAKPPVVGTVTTSGDSIYQKNYGGGNSDGYLYKMNADGKSVAWWTFLGGGGMDDIWAVEYAKEGANEFLYIAGYTNANIPIPASKLISGALYKGGYDGFVAKMDAKSGDMVWFNWISTPNSNDAALSIKISDNFVHVGGSASQGLATTTGAYKTTLAMSFIHDGFYARFDKKGNKNYMTYTGFQHGFNMIDGGNPEGKKGVINIEVIGDDDVLLAGTSYFTASGGNGSETKEVLPIIPSDAVATTNNPNGYVMRLKVNTSTVPFSTRIRGTAASTLTNATDVKYKNGYIYLLGISNGVIAGLPTWAYQKTNKGGTDAYVLKIDASNYTIANASMYGGSGNEYVGNLNICSGEPTFSGQTYSTDLPVIDYLTTGDLSSSTIKMDIYKGNSDYFFASFKNDFSSLTFATYLGGSGLEHSYNSDIMGNIGGQALIGGDILFAASTHSKTDMPTTIGSWKHVTDAAVVSSSGDLDFIIRFEKKGASCIALTTVTPTLDLDFPGDSISGLSNNYKTTYLENPGTKVSIANSKSNGVSIVDTDSPNLIGATLTLTNAKANDVLEIVGTLPSGISSSVTSASGVITINLSNSATLADYQTAIQQIKFSISSQNPDATVKRIVTVTVNDGFDISMVDTTFITIIPFNNTPLVDLDVNNSSGKIGLDYQTSYTENSTGVSIGDIDVTISDSDNTTLSNATVTLLSYVKGDTLKPFSIPSSINANVIYNPTNIVINLSGKGTLSEYQTAIKAIQYKSTSDTLIADKTVEVIVSDGNSNSLPAYAYIKFNARNDAPVLDLDANYSTKTGSDFLTTFTENNFNITSPIVGIDVLVSDVDNANINNATINFTNVKAGDNLIIGTLPAGISSSVVNSLGNITITLTGSATKADYETALKEIVFDNKRDDVDTTTRLITFVVNDGTLPSNSATAYIKVINVNDTLIVTNEHLFTYENVKIINPITSITVNDIEPDKDVLTVSSIVKNASHGNIIIAGNSYEYTPNNNYIGYDSIIFNICDNKGACGLDTLFITIIPVIDIDTITFSDSHFKTALINKGIDLNNDGKIQRKEIVNVRKLNLSNSSIADLAGIEAFVNLDTLIVSNNSLTSLNVKALTNLKYLDASFNQLVGLNDQNFANQRLAVSNNTKLQTLLINNNQLTSLDVRNLASLKYLNASINNPLSVICVSDQQDLTYFTADLNVVYSTSCGLVTDANDEVKSTEKVLIKVYNLFGQEVIHSENNSGFYIYQYSDGSTEKVLR